MQAWKKTIIVLAVAAAFVSWFPQPAFAVPWISYEECKAHFTPPEDRATVYFFRPQQKTATDVAFAVYDESGQTIAFILNNSFSTVFLPPGKASLSTQKTMFIKPIEFSLDLEAGKTYYVRFQIKSGGMKNQPSAEVLPAAGAEDEIRNCRLYVSKEVKKDLSKLPEYLDLE